MARPSTRPRPRRRQTRSRRAAQTEAPAPPHVSLPRLAIVLPLVAFALALGFQWLLKAAGLESDHPLRIFATPLVAAAVVFFGLRHYPRAGRIRLAVMVGVALFLFALFT